MFIKPSAEILEQSYVKDYEKLYKQVEQNPETFWNDVAQELHWFKPWSKVLDGDFPLARWFINAQCNIVSNALDRHLD